jgi:hypothetical protein
MVSLCINLCTKVLKSKSSKRGATSLGFETRTALIVSIVSVISLESQAQLCAESAKVAERILRQIPVGSSGK